MGAFRKKKRLVEIPLSHGHEPEIIFDKTVSVEHDGKVKTFIETVEVSASDYASSKFVPKPENYTLESLLAAGVNPQKVNVAGMLDNFDESEFNELSSSMFVKLRDGMASSSESMKEEVPVEQNVES